MFIIDIKIIEKGDKNYPKQLREIKQSPKRLYILGNEKLLQNESLAIVGSRSSSEYGVKYAKQFAQEIAKEGITIISGLALGIDSAAHEAAKNCKGGTIAVVGCGLNHIYPEENKELFQSILENQGCIISEYEPNEPVDMRNFPKRNRIISGLTNGVLVVEAGYRSGSTITGRLGLEQGKNVYCIPRDLGDSKGVGTNELIQKGAKLVICPQDILQDYGRGYGKIENKETGENMTKQSEIQEGQMKAHISKEYINIYQLITYTPQNIQYFANRSGLKIAEVTQKLIMLELQGHIKSMPRKLLYKDIKVKNVSKTYYRKDWRGCCNSISDRKGVSNYRKEFLLQARRN